MDTIVEQIQVISLTSLSMAAALYDLELGLIPNALTVTGLAMGLVWQLYCHGILGILLFLGGALLPVLLLSVLYYFRMIGAGDIKLFMAIGAFLGPGRVFCCIERSAVIGAAFALFLLLSRRILTERLQYFLRYIADSKDGRWKPYLSDGGSKARFCFSLSVLMSVIFCIAGGG